MRTIIAVCALATVHAARLKQKIGHTTLSNETEQTTEMDAGAVDWMSGKLAYRNFRKGNAFKSSCGIKVDGARVTEIMGAKNCKKMRLRSYMECAKDDRCEAVLDNGEGGAIFVPCSSMNVRVKSGSHKRKCTSGRGCTHVRLGDCGNNKNPFLGCRCYKDPDPPFVQSAAPAGESKMCKDHSGCVKVGLHPDDGLCCPVKDGTRLACCNRKGGKPPSKLPDPKNGDSVFCRHHAKCKHLKPLDGLCCPVADGTRLACCDKESFMTHKGDQKKKDIQKDWAKQHAGEDKYCRNHPRCKHLKGYKNECCPHFSGTRLACCGAGKHTYQPTDSPLCKYHPECKKLGLDPLDGLCCPVADGTRLACCS